MFMGEEDLEFRIHHEKRQKRLQEEERRREKAKLRRDTSAMACSTPINEDSQHSELSSDEQEYKPRL
jgi:hypothetical protein